MIVIDRFEMVDINHHCRQRLVELQCISKHLVEVLEEGTTIDTTRQRVSRCQDLKLLVLSLDFFRRSIKLNHHCLELVFLVFQQSHVLETDQNTSALAFFVPYRRAADTIGIFYFARAQFQNATSGLITRFQSTTPWMNCIGISAVFCFKRQCSVDFPSDELFQVCTSRIQQRFVGKHNSLIVV